MKDQNPIPKEHQEIREIKKWESKEIERIKSETRQKILDVRSKCKHQMSKWNLITVHGNMSNFEEYYESECANCGYKEVKIILT